MGGGPVWLVAYALLVGSVFTPLYEPLSQGDDESWGVLLLLAAAHIGAGAGLRRWPALLLPVPVCALGVVLSDSPLETAFAVIAAPVGALFVAAGWGLALIVKRGSVAAAVAFLAALGPVAWAAVEQVDRADAPHAPPSLEAQLPIELSLGNLCPGAETPPDETRKLRRQAEVLIRELRLHPDWLVDYTYYYTDTSDPEDTREITIRELAEEQLADLGDGSDCQPELRRRLEEALG